MAKALKTAALVVGAVVAIAAAIPTAGGSTLLASALGVGVGTASAIAAGVGLATQLIATATSKKPSAQATGSQTQFSADPDAGIPYVLGRTGTAGNIVMRQGFNTSDAGDNDRQSFVSVLSLGPVKSVGGFKVDREAQAFNGAGQAIGTFAGFMWMMTQLGALPEPALGFGTGAGTPPGWTAAHKLSGLAAASWTLRFDTKAKLYQNGVPAPMWVVEGGLCYNPKLDSTYPGGSGPHRMADPSDTAAYDAAVATWEYSEDPYLHALKWVHGIWQRDKNNPASTYQRVMGMGAPWAGIDVASFVEGSNIAEANGWKVGGVIFSADSKWESLKKILQAGMGEPLTLGAKVSCLVNAPKVSLATVTIDDVVGEATVSATQPRRDRPNTITPRYRLEANNWQLLPGAPITVPEYVTLDRGKRSKVQDYAFIQNAKQVATAVRYDIENAREFGPIVLPLKLFWMGFKPGDCVTVTLPELGLNGQPVLLLNRDLDPSSGIATMTARSETPGKHPFALGQTTTPPTTPALSGPPLVPVPGALAWDIAATGLTKDGITFPALVITGAVDAGSAEAVVFEYRPFLPGQAADANWRVAGTEPVGTERKEITGLLPLTAYEAAVSYRVRGVIGARRILGPETTAADTAADTASAALGAAQAAQGLASGKSTIFYQATPPTAAESSENDRWVDTSNGNFEYRRIPGNGRISYGGTVVTFPGFGAIVYPPWAPAPDQRIAQALTDAAGAQATADGKVATFSQEATPTAEGLGDLWYQPSTKSLKRWDGSAWGEVATVGATPEQLNQITQALSDAADAQATADGKIDSFYQSAPPAVFGEGDYWTDTDDNKLYRASGNSSAGGVWVSIRDNGIGIAIAAAAGAQETADGKVTSFVGTVAPTAEGTGDLWYNPTTGELKRWDGDSWDATADKTALNQQTVADVLPIDVAADYTGAIDAGTWPVLRRVTRLVGTTDVSPQTNFTVSASTGLTVSINNAPGSADRGVVSLTGMTVPVGTITVTTNYGGQPIDKPISVTRSDGPPPAPGGGGSTTYPSSVSSYTTPGTSTTHVPITVVMSASIGTSGNATVTVPLKYFGSTGATLGVKVQKSSSPTTGWTDASSEVVGTVASTSSGDRQPGFVTLTVNLTGVPFGTYYFRIVGRSPTGINVGGISGTTTINPTA